MKTTCLLVLLSSFLFACAPAARGRSAANQPTSTTRGQTAPADDPAFGRERGRW